MRHKISVVIPIYKCGDCLEELSRRISAALSTITDSYEVILVDDGCPMDGWSAIQTEISKRANFKGLKLSRNFGQHVAISAGLDYVDAEWIVVMDGDLQDDPDDIPRFYEKALEGYDIVVGIANRRNSSYRKELGSRLFYHILGRISRLNFSSRTGNFGIYSARCIGCVKSMREQHKSFGLFMGWIGFNRAEVEVRRNQRYSGKSSYSLLDSAWHAINNLTSNSNRLMNWMIKFGFLMSSASLLAGLMLVVRTLVIAPSTATGWSSIIVSLYFATGLIVGCLGILGIYIGRIFDQVKDRPLYFIEETMFNE